ncbi:MAG: HlyD family secretion protein, partial [Candidatus Sericytochromatia bacterium]
MKNQTGRRLVLPALLLATILTLNACQPASKADYQLYTVASGSLELSIPETGELGSAQEVRVNSPFAGTLSQLLPEGSVLKKGQVLGRLETTSKAQERTSAQLSLNEAQVDLRLSAVERLRRAAEGKAKQATAGHDLKIEATRLKQLQTERDTVALTRVRENLRTLEQRMDILELEARERGRLYELGYLSRQERDQAQLQLDQARQERAQQQAELTTLQAGPRKQEIGRQQLMLSRAKDAQRLAGQEAKVQLRVAEVQKRSAESRIAKYKKRYGYYDSLVRSGTLLAPAAGTLVYGKLKVGEEEVPIKSGDAVQEGVELVRLVDLAQPVLRLLIHEIDAPRVRVGQRVRLRFDAWPDKIYAGSVSRMLTVARQPLEADREEVRRFACEIKLLKPDASLRPGMTAQAEIVAER